MPALLSAQTATDATAIVQQFLQKVEQQTLSADYSLVLIEGSNQQPAGNGVVKMRGPKFLITMLESEAAFDGKTLYVYQEDINELTLSTPAEQELLEVNPVLFAKALLKVSAVRFSASQKDDKAYVIDFVPNDQSVGIQRFVLKLRKKDLAPLEVVVREGKQQTRVRFTNAAFSSETPVFKLQKKDAFVNDMR